MSLMPRLSTLLLVVLGGCAAAEVSFEDRRLATIPEDARVLVPVSFSRDGRRAAYVEQKGDTCRTVTGSHVGRPYSALC